jgi:hypothetical protein
LFVDELRAFFRLGALVRVGLSDRMASDAGVNELDKGGTVAYVLVLTAQGMFDRLACRTRPFDLLIQLGELAHGEPPPLVDGDTL